MLHFPPDSRQSRVSISLANVFCIHLFMCFGFSLLLICLEADIWDNSCYGDVISHLHVRECQENACGVDLLGFWFCFNCSGANSLLCQSSAQNMRREYNGTGFYPLIMKKCIFLLIEHKFPTCSLMFLKDKCPRAVLCQTLSHFCCW